MDIKTVCPIAVHYLQVPRHVLPLLPQLALISAQNPMQLVAPEGGDTFPR